MKKNTSMLSLIAIIVAVSFSYSCEQIKNMGKNVNLFPISQDKQLGLQVKEEINSNTTEYKILDRSKYATAYSHLDRITNNILNSGKVEHKNDFAWETYIIHDDNVLNAFCTPGGYIYVYTGLIKYLDSESDLAGVMGHEIAHADLRHSTSQLTKQYGIEILGAIALGEKSQTTVAQVAKSMVGLKFSRDHETQADANSVSYLCPTIYHADGAASFFEKLVKNNQTGGTPEFLSTHPSPANRVEAIKAKSKTMSCKAGQAYTSQYAAFKKALP